MTYCLALRLDEGLVFLSDTRTNAGVDDVGTYRKLHVLRPDDDRLFVVTAPANAKIDPMPACQRIWRDASRNAAIASVTTLPKLSPRADRTNRAAPTTHPPGCRVSPGIRTRSASQRSHAG